MKFEVRKLMNCSSSNWAQRSFRQVKSSSKCYLAVIGYNLINQLISRYLFNWLVWKKTPYVNCFSLPLSQVLLLCWVWLNDVVLSVMPALFGAPWGVSAALPAIRLGHTFCMYLSRACAWWGCCVSIACVLPHRQRICCSTASASPVFPHSIFLW